MRCPFSQVAKKLNFGAMSNIFHFVENVINLLLQFIEKVLRIHCVKLLEFSSFITTNYGGD